MSIFDFDRDTTHVGFADEAYWSNQVEFRAVACVSARRKDYDEVERRLCNSRCDAGAIASEIKWSKTRNRDRQDDATAALNATLALATERKLHIDVIVWDEQGRNHLDRLRASGNREVMHLQLMYRFLFSRVIAHWRQTDNTVAPHWTFAPDRQEGVDFHTVQRDLYLDPALPGGAVVSVVDVKSALNYSLQLADLLAGIAAYSHESATEYETWLRLGKQPHLQLPASQWATRFPILESFHLLCEGNDLGPTMLSPIPSFTGRGLCTQERDPTLQTVNIQPFAPLS